MILKELETLGLLPLHMQSHTHNITHTHHTHAHTPTHHTRTHTQLLAGNSSTRIPQTKPPAPSNSFSNPPPPTTPSGSSAGWAGKKRARTFDLDDNTKRRRTTPYSARQSGEKQHNKGLRHFSQRVCEKVREKGTTTYNEVCCYWSVLHAPSSLSTYNYFWWKLATCV